MLLNTVTHRERCFYHSFLITTFLRASPTTSGPWRDCQHVLESGETTSGIYLLRPQSANRLLQAWCEQSRAQGGWTVIQRRQDGSVNFFRTWEQYKVIHTQPAKLINTPESLASWGPHQLGHVHHKCTGNPFMLLMKR